MAAWRTKACELFGARPGTFSFRWGVVEVADALYDALSRAIREGDDEWVARVFDYALWADANINAEHLRSAVDICFFMKLFHDPEMEALAVKYLPPEVVSSKRKWPLESSTTRQNSPLAAYSAPRAEDRVLRTPYPLPPTPPKPTPAQPPPYY